ncbi:MAG TPA: HalX domain-containing protein [Halobacteriales archaeon]|nr:HalX domain-containing protein [Halobacteriales archaeon]
MATGSASRATVLVVDDEEEVADVYALQLETQYDVLTAYGGEEALDVVTEDVDVTLLDRRMPDLSGDEVLDRIRDRGIGCRVIMTTAVNPDFDIMQMPFDDYLCKPIDGDVLRSAIDQQLAAREYDVSIDEYFSVTSKLALLQTEKPTQELTDNPEYRRLKRRADELRETMDRSLDNFDDIDVAFQNLSRGPDI